MHPENQDRIKRLADYPTRGHDRQVGDLGTQALHGAFPLLLDFLLGLGDDLSRLFPGFLLELLAKALPHTLSLVHHLLSFLARFIELSAVLLLGGFPVTLGPLRRFYPFLDAGAPRLEHLHQRPPRHQRQDQQREELAQREQADLKGRVGQLVELERRGDGGDLTAEGRDRLADEEAAKGRVVPQRRDVDGHPLHHRAGPAPPA